MRVDLLPSLTSTGCHLEGAITSIKIELVVELELSPNQKEAILWLLMQFHHIPERYEIMF